MSLSKDPYNPGRRSFLGAGLSAVIQSIKEDEEYKEEEKPAEITFREAELVTVEKVLQTIDRNAEKRISEGFSEINFTSGVLHCFMVAIVFSAFPQHFWVVYGAECLYLLPKTLIYNWRAKPLNQVLYYLDYCWVMNILGSLLLFLVSLSAVSLFSYEKRREIFMMAIGTTSGTLTGACLILPFVAVVFHDMRTMTGVLIHLLPTMMAYCFVWHREAIHEAWPTIFPYVYDKSELQFFPDGKARLFLPGTGTGSIAGNAVALYTVWWTAYVIWMIFLGGMDLPRKDRDKPPTFDTVFHSTVRHGLTVVIGKACWGRRASVSQKQQETDHYEVRDFFVYMTFHALGAYLATMTLANVSWHSRRAHMAIIMLLTVVAVYRGAARYTYYATDMYGTSIRKEFKDILPERKEKKKDK